MKLLIDEHYSYLIAEKLREIGHDVVSVKERPALIGLDDKILFDLMIAEERAIMTENWADFDPIVRQAAADGTTHFGVIFTSRNKLPRTKSGIGRYVEVLTSFLDANRDVNTIMNSARWLP